MDLGSISSWNCGEHRVIGWMLRLAVKGCHYWGWRPGGVQGARVPTRFWIAAPGDLAGPGKATSHP
jgi:hypothetical protein